MLAFAYCTQLVLHLMVPRLDNIPCDRFYINESTRVPTHSSNLEHALIYASALYLSLVKQKMISREIADRSPDLASRQLRPWQPPAVLHRAAQPPPQLEPALARDEAAAISAPTHVDALAVPAQASEQPKSSLDVSAALDDAITSKAEATKATKAAEAKAAKAAAKTKPAATTKPAAKSKAKAKATKGGIMKRPASDRILGCSKCRYLKNGCSACR